MVRRNELSLPGESYGCWERYLRGDKDLPEKSDPDQDRVQMQGQMSKGGG